MRRVLLVGLALLAIVFGATPGHAEKRVALVIGNSNYQQAGVLPNPVNDATAMAALFRSAGFSVVETRTNSGIAQMRRAIGDFAETAQDSDVAVVYFAGHGIEVDGANYLIPVDAVLARDFDVEDETVSLDRVLHAIEPARRLRLVILDACRNNPFASTMRRSTRAIGRGFARVDPSASDTLVAFAAKAGSIAADGDGQHSPFTAALLQHLVTPGLDIRLALGEVRDTVLAATSRRQEPFVYGSLGGRTVALVMPPEQERPGPSPPSVAPVAAPSNLPVRRSNQAGGTGGMPFDDKDINAQTAPVTGLTITVARSVADRRQKLIGKVQAHWADAAGLDHGGPPGAVMVSPETRTIRFDKDEAIRRFVIFHRRFNWPDPAHAPVWISGIQVQTSKTTYAFGDVDGTATDCNLAANEKIVGFFGRAGSYLDALGCVIR